MKPSSKYSLKSASSAVVLALLAGLPITASAASQTWNVVGDGNWDTTSSNWTGAGSTWSNGNDAYFTGAGGTVTIDPADPVFSASSLDVGKIDFTGSTGVYTLDNTGGVAVNISGAGIINPSGQTHIISSTGPITFSNSASAGSANISVSNLGDVTFGGSSTAGAAAITNDGNLYFTGSSQTGASTATIANGGILSLAGHTGTVTVGSLTNTGTFGSGIINTSSSTLALTNLTLNPSSNSLNFDLTGGVGNSGEITVSGAFTGSTGSHNTGITFTSAVPVAAGTYTLIDWSGASTTSVDFGDFLANPALFPPNLTAGSYLRLNPLNLSQLQLVAVPEPATFAMPLAACVGLLMLRRRTMRLVA